MKQYSKFLLIFFACLVINIFGGINIFESHVLAISHHNLPTITLASAENISDNINVDNNGDLVAQQTEEKKDTPKKENSEKPASNKTTNNGGFPVTFEGETLFSFSEPIANISPEVRAKRAPDAIKRFADDRSLEPKTLQINQLSEKLVLLSTKDIVIATFAQADAKSANLTLEQLSIQYQQQIITSVEKYREERGFKTILFNSLIAVAVTIGFFIVVKLLRFIYRWINKKLEAREHSLLKNIRIQGLQLVSRKQQKLIISTIFKVSIWAIYLVLFFTYLGILFKIFPRTEKYSDIVFSAFQSAIGSAFTAFMGYLPNLFIIGLTLFLTQYIVKFSNILFRAIKDKSITIPGFYEEWAEPTGRLMILLIYAMALALIFPYLPGANSPAFRGVSVFIGALVTFGGASAISNVIGGVIMIYTRAYEIGDLVKVGDVVGNVLEKTILSTRIRTPNNQIVTIPNSTIVSTNIVNYTATNRELKEPLILNTTITLGYDVPWRQVHEVLIDAAKATNNISKEFQPFVLQTALNDFSVSYELKAYSELGLRPSLVPRIYSEMHQNIQDKCNEAGIEILSPHFSAIRDGSHLTIPSNYLPDDYQAPGFKIDK